MTAVPVPSAVLRATAATIRERAKNATQGRRWDVDSHAHLTKGCRCLWCHDEPWAWEIDVIDGPACQDVNGCYHVMHLGYADAEHIASWDPTTALAVADWLDSEAIQMDVHIPVWRGDNYKPAVDDPPPFGWNKPEKVTAAVEHHFRNALAFCRAYNRDAS